MKMVPARLKMSTLSVIITVSVMTTAVVQMEHGCMEIGFIRQIMVFLVMK